MKSSGLKVAAAGAVLIGVLAAVNVQVSQVAPAVAGRPRAERHHMSAFSDDRPGTQLRLLFIHHSVGGTLLASPGAVDGDDATCIYRSHPNGGGLRSDLEDDGYEVHEMSYGSRIGAKTDLFDWLPKFRTAMDSIRTTDRQDRLYDDGRRNHVVVFKSCFPNSNFVGEGVEPGNPDGPELTVANAKATLTALLSEFERQPDTLFVYVTSPPLASELFREKLWKLALKRAIGKPNWAEEFAARAAMARQFNDWVTAPDGWLQNYPRTNVVAFDYYDILTGDGASNLSQFPTEFDGVIDSHPSAQGNARAAERFVPFLNRAVRRAGLSN